MDVRSIEAKAPVVEHNGTVPVWWMIESREFKDITDGGLPGAGQRVRGARVAAWSTRTPTRPTSSITS